MNERLKELRKALGLTQSAFAARINISPGAIGNYEVGRNVPIDAVISSICREFRVNETWLRTGEGEKFAEDNEDVFDILAREYGLNEYCVTAVRIFSELPPASQDAILDFVRRLSDQLTPAPKRPSIEDAEALYRKSLLTSQIEELFPSHIIAATGTTDDK